MPIPKALKGLAPSSVRVVGQRKIPSPATAAGFQADLDGFSVEQFEDAWAEIEARTTASHRVLPPVARKEHERLLLVSPPSIRAVEFVFSHAFDQADALCHKIASGHHALIVLRYQRADGWLGHSEKALSRALRRIALRLDAGVPMALDSLGSAGVQSGADDLGADIEFYIERLALGHIIAQVHDSETMDEVLAAISDVVVDLDVGCGALAYAVAERFPGAVWPADIDPETVTPKLLDVATARGTTADEAFEILRSMIAAIVERKAREAGALATAATKVDKASKVETKKGEVEVLRPTAPTIADIHVPAAVRVWCEDLARDLLGLRQGRLTWPDVDCGCLWYGPPGTGKTMLACALAATLGVAFIPTSFAKWQGPKGGHLGDVINAAQKVFETAVANAPCLVFIDEIDAVPPRGRSDRHDDYWRAIVNALLELLDGTTSREGVVVIAATNDPSSVDPALLRSGRLDRRFEIGLPDEDGLVAVMRHHLPALDAETLRPAATTLAGTASPADVARIAREARRVARREDRTVTAEDLLAIAMPADDRPADLVARIAVHEAGHAVGYLHYGVLPMSLSLVRSDGSGARVHVRDPEGIAMEARVVPLLTARAAEEAILGEPSIGASGDLVGATRMVAAMIDGGLGQRLAVAGQATTTEIEPIVRRYYAEATMIVLRRRAAIEALAKLAVERRVLSGRALAAFADEHGFEVRP